MPDVVVLADHTEQYNWRYEDCLVLNPGSFPTDFLSSYIAHQRLKLNSVEYDNPEIYHSHAAGMKCRGHFVLLSRVLHLTWQI